MTNHDIFTQLHKLKELKPRQEWRDRSRDILLSEINSSASSVSSTKKISWRFQFSETLRFYIPRPARVAFKPVLISVIVLALILEGGILTVNAAKGSVPGDTFYPVKVAVEKVQISLTSGEDAKAKLEVEFAGRRVEEIVKISREANSPEKQKKVEVAASGLKQNITTAKNRLEKLNKQAEPQKAVAVAQVLEKKTGEYHEALTQTIIIEPVEEVQATVKAAIDSTVKEAIEAVDNTSDQAVEVIVERVVSGEAEVSIEEAAGMVEKKIEKTQAKIEETKVKLDAVSVKVDEVKEAAKPEVEKGDGVVIETVDTEVAAMSDEISQAVSQGEEASKTLEEAKELLTLDDLAGAVSKVKEVKDIVKENEKVAEDQGEAVEIFIEKVE